MEDLIEARNYLENKAIWAGTWVADMNAPENYFKLVELLEDYYQVRLNSSNRKDQSPCERCGNTGRCEPRTLSDPDGQECDCGAN